MIKAVFLDIDGTLVSFQTHHVPASTIEALTALHRKGIKTFVATGRQFHAIDNLGTLQFDGYITLNGSYCLEGTDKVIYKHAIEPGDIHSLIRYQNKTETFPCAFVYENTITINFTNQDTDHILHLLNFPAIPVRPLHDYAGEEVFQLIAFFKTGQEQRIMQAIPHCESTRWNPLFTDVVPQGSSKAVGIDKILAYYNIELKDTIAFGDGGNDIPMLCHAGIGVAMGNAEKEVKEAADYVTSSVDEDGILKALQHFRIL
ncbi:Cof-type HAD-IIB family hydrolase [Parabacteroides pacaensis]|uniref:Cof-type HAD-IIB family hydrolase n=1 Tax=Parabacteroides pacaensis TaxID=2086575 RepID=UPI000D0EC2A9|nr:Cof-type HAD-IIB family hydrolase [Parabacteroides pacaensis]